MRKILLPAIAVFFLSGCAAMHAQNPGAGFGPVNAQPVEAGALMLGGYDVVSYFKDGRAARGSAAHRSTFKAVNFHFASAEHKALFDAAPQNYLPQYGGFCTNGIVYAIPWGGSGDSWKMIDGKLYIFGGDSSRDAFMLDAKRNLALADGYWKNEVEGANSFWQRSKRLLFRVPHYRSGEELAVEVAAAKKAGKLPL
jgi:YHS domain-containing protein